MSETTATCPRCGKWYFIYNMTAKDQSACPPCVRAAIEEAEANR